MDCQKAQRLLSEHIDGALAARRAWNVDRHLASCHACTLLHNELRKGAAVAQSAPRLDAPSGFAARVSERIAAAERAAPRRRLRIPSMPAWATAAAAVALVALVVHNPVRGPARGPVNAVAAHDAAFLRPTSYDRVALVASSPLDDVSAATLSSIEAQDVDVTRGAGALAQE